jgi:hypothetical protein
MITFLNNLMQFPRFSGSLLLTIVRSAIRCSFCVCCGLVILGLMKSRLVLVSCTLCCKQSADKL